jgi:hypothetical protein
MTLPACFEDLNANWFASVTSQVNSVTSAAELQTLVNQVFGTIALLNSTIESQVGYMAAFEALLTPPGESFSAIIAWITSMIAVLTQMYAPLAKMTTQLTAIAAQVAELTSTIEAVAAAQFPGVTITIPSVAAFCEI